MTGYGRGSAATEAGAVLVVELNAVNRRHQETVFSMPREWQALEMPMTEAIRKVVRRGRVQVLARLEPGSGAQTSPWNEAAAEASFKRLQDLARAWDCQEQPTSDTLLKVLLLHRDEGPSTVATSLEAPALQALAEALTGLQQMRTREGEALALDLRQRCTTLAELREAIAGASTGASRHYQEALLERLRQMQLDLNLEDERVLKEIALFADRSDVSEELTRLASHLEQFAETLAIEDEAIGRKLEFILQEINREFTTIGSKGNLIEVSRGVIEAKNELERVREQLQNVE